MNSRTALPHAKFRRLSYALVMIVLAALILPSTAGRRKKAAKAEPLKEPDYLLPVDPPRGDWQAAYRDKLVDVFHLEGDKAPRMVVRPVLKAEYVLRIVIDSPEDKRSKSDHCQLSLTTADRNIWYARAENNSDRENKPVNVSSISTAIPLPLGERLENLWTRMLSRTRPNEGKPASYGGVTYEFAKDGKSGKTSSPQEAASPRYFVELGDSLVAYCQASESNRPRILQEITEKTAILEASLKSRSSK